MTQILFYDLHHPYGEFSNFSRHTVELSGLSWPTTEHYFQAQKFAGTADAELTEHTTNDSYWADGDGSGRNRLGELLMEVRAELRRAD
jgi:predicted NAD-dependent protein-ADP-ribosyltransferase YbiA (DUF1768 family)